MANRQILEALEKYSGDVESLNQVVGIATQELGSDWTEKIYEDMSDASADIKERLDHAFNYYAATTAWNEIQNYLTQTEPLNYSETLERVPVLEHWLSFFGAAGEEVVEELRNKLRKQAQDSAQRLWMSHLRYLLLMFKKRLIISFRIKRKMHPILKMYLLI